MQNEEIRKFNFSDVEIVISDSKDFLKFAYKNKLPKSTKVFTTSIIDRDIKKYIKNKKNIDTNFMTICFDSTKKARIDLISTLHPYDHTIRPQIVKKKTCKYYYNLIEEFRKISGIGALLNTSLNIHEKPIIYKPVEIIKELLKNSSIPLNYLLIEKDLYVRVRP